MSCALMSVTRGDRSDIPGVSRQGRELGGLGHVTLGSAPSGARAVWPGAQDAGSLCLSFLICKWDDPVLVPVLVPAEEMRDGRVGLRAELSAQRPRAAVVPVIVSGSAVGLEGSQKWERPGAVGITKAEDLCPGSWQLLPAWLCGHAVGWGPRPQPCPPLRPAPPPPGSWGHRTRQGL